jgi:hypothetical protein
MKLSIIVPGIRYMLWDKLYETIFQSCTKYDFEVIFVGPFMDGNSSLWNIMNVKYIRDFGCPSRALQIGSVFAEGEYLTYTSDDCISRKNSLDKVLDNINSDIVSLQYSESPNFSGNQHPLEYYNAWHHRDLQCKNVDKDWKIPIIFLMKTSLYYEYGGLDCRFEHINMNLHDMAFRMQMDNKVVEVSEDCVWDANYVHRQDTDPVIAAFKQNDKPLFDSIWDIDKFDRELKIDINNWKQASEIWDRRCSNENTHNRT